MRTILVEKIVEYRPSSRYVILFFFFFLRLCSKMLVDLEHGIGAGVCFLEIVYLTGHTQMMKNER